MKTLLVLAALATTEADQQPLHCLHPHMSTQLEGPIHLNQHKHEYSFQELNLAGCHLKEGVFVSSPIPLGIPKVQVQYAQDFFNSIIKHDDFIDLKKDFCDLTNINDDLVSGVYLSHAYAAMNEVRRDLKNSYYEDDKNICEAALYTPHKFHQFTWYTNGTVHLEHH